MSTPTGVLFQNPIVKPLSPNGAFMASCTATFYLTGSTTLTNIYADGALTTPLANPLSADASGTFVPVYLNPATVYRVQVKTQAGVLISDTDPYVPASTGSITQSIIGQTFYPQTAAEIAVSVAPVNFGYPSGTVDRYGTNTTPGTTPMGAALNNAITVALAAGGGVPVRFLAGAYNIDAKPTFGAATVNIIPLDIGGVGIGTQLICNITSGAGPLFDMTAKNGWWLHDFLMCGNSVHKNNGIAVNNTGSAEAIEWRISRITSLMPGVGFFISNTNTGVIEGVRHWPGNNPTLIVPQTVTNSDISHGIYLTGSFVHNVSIYDADCPPNSNYNAANRGIKCDAQFSFGVTIVAPLVQTLSGNNNETGIDWNPSGSTAGLTITGAYNEGTAISLGNVSQSTISGLSDGSISGSLILGPACRENTITGVNQQVLKITDIQSFGNVFIGCQFRAATAWSSSTAYTPGQFVSSGGVNYLCILANTNQAPPNATYWSVYGALFVDATETASITPQPNRFQGCTLPGYGSGVSDLGSKWSNILTYAHTMVLDAFNGNQQIVRVGDTSAFSFNAPLNGRNGQEIEVVIRNENLSSALGTMTVNGLNGGLVGWTPPLAGKNRAFCIFYSGFFGAWYQKWVGSVDISN